jgi:acetate kinase
MGLAGTADMREVVARAGAGDPAAALALDVFVHRARAGVAAMAAALGGVDGLVFTGGIGEHAPVVRRMIVDGLGFLGARVDEAANRSDQGDALVSPPGSEVGVAVVEAREDLEIAREVRRLLEGP